MFSQEICKSSLKIRCFLRFSPHTDPNFFQSFSNVLEQCGEMSTCDAMFHDYNYFRSSKNVDFYNAFPNDPLEFSGYLTIYLHRRWRFFPKIALTLITCSGTLQDPLYTSMKSSIGLFSYCTEPD